MRFRPWGSLSWVLSLASPSDWYFVGCIGTEERSLAGWKHLRDLGVVMSQEFAQIDDVDSEKYRDATRVALSARRAEYLHAGGDLNEITNLDLLAELFEINAFAARASRKKSIIFDITSFPKRFFFPILRLLVNAPELKNLVVLYTSPSSYADDAPLYEDMDQWRVLPGFGGSATRDEVWIVSVGFLVESLRQYVSGNPDGKMKLLIPFPAPLSMLRRTWESVATLERELPADRFEKFRVEPLDISAAFDRICSLAGKPELPLAFAPYGPKPTSAAMCLYAMQRDSSVHYAQPTVYHPGYSVGVRGNDPHGAVSSYWVKHEGENLFAI